MEVIQKLISSTKRLAVEEEEVREQVIRLKTQLIAEENYLANALSDKHGLAQQNVIYEQSNQVNENYIQMALKFQDVAKSSVMVHSFLQIFIEETQPTTSQQRECLANLIAKKEIMLNQYETSQTYKKILEEELQERELTRLIEEKRNELIELSQNL